MSGHTHASCEKHEADLISEGQQKEIRRGFLSNKGEDEERECARLDNRQQNCTTCSSLRGNEMHDPRGDKPFDCRTLLPPPPCDAYIYLAHLLLKHGSSHPFIRIVPFSYYYR